MHQHEAPTASATGAGPSATGAQHHFDEHTGEVRLKLVAASREELFAEAGRALSELMLGEAADELELSAAQAVDVSSRDRAALLVDWLNELIYLSEIQKQVFTRFRVEHVDDGRLRAVIAGVSPEAIKTAVKAATLHGAAVELEDGSWRATVVLDV